MLDVPFIDEIQRPWDRMPKEPKEWHRIFKDYYLPLGQSRSLRNAFEFYIRVEEPKQYESIDPDNVMYTPSHWNQYARDFEWAKRALAFDQEKSVDFGQVHVKQVMDFLQSNAMVAATALVDALKSERTRVQAANSVLNRIGVPETSEISIKTGVSVSADEMAEAASKVDAWKTQRLSG